MCLKMAISPGLTFGILRYLIMITIVTSQLLLNKYTYITLKLFNGLMESGGAGKQSPYKISKTTDHIILKSLPDVKLNRKY